MAWKWLEDAADATGDFLMSGFEPPASKLQSQARAGVAARAESSRPGLEASKEGQVAETERKQSETIDYAQQAMKGGAIVDPSVKVNLLEKLDAARRQQLAGAAADGVMHSGALGQARRSAAQKQAMGTAALVAEEERAKRERLMQIEQQRAAVQAGVEKIPSVMQDVNNAPPVETFKARREMLAKRDTELQSMIAALDKQRHTPEQLQSMFNQEIEGTYAQLAKQAIGEAQRLGMSDQYIQGLQRSFEQDKARAIRDSGQMVAALSGPDPQQAEALLQTMYRPDLYEAAAAARKDPTLSILLGATGALVGGVALAGGAPGAASGWGVGTSLGQALG